MVMPNHAWAWSSIIALPVLMLVTTTAMPQIGGAGSLVEIQPGAAANASMTNRNGTQYIEGELLVRYRAGTESYRQQQSLALAGVRKAERPGRRGYRHVILQPGQSVERAMQTLAVDPSVAHVQPNYVYRTSRATSDPMFEQQWGLDNVGQLIRDGSYSTNNPGVPGNDIDATGAWELISDCSDVVVAVIDTGVNYTHADLAANMWDGGAQWPNHGYDFFDGDNDPMPEGGGEDHGTHVAGVIGAVGNNGEGITGVCQQASIMSVRVLGPDGSGTTLSISLGVDFAVDNGASVLNMSLGGVPEFDQVLSDSIDGAGRADVLVVVAAGNSGLTLDSTNREYPCSFTHENLLCVAALDQAYELAHFSNRGESVVHVGAPGTNTLSAMGGRSIAEPLTGGWSMSTDGDWELTSCQGSRLLTNPSDWCAGGTYANDADDRVWKTHSLPANGLAASARFSTSFSLHEGNDYFRLAGSTDTGDPFINGIPLAEATGHTSTFQQVTVGLGPAGCASGDCTFGFQLESGSPVTGDGIAVRDMSIETLEHGSTSYQTLNGTSMASPHAAGVAALVRAFNPDFTALDTRNALIGGGRNVAALDRETTSGRAVDAGSALMWLDPPSAPRVRLR